MELWQADRSWIPNFQRFGGRDRARPGYGPWSGRFLLQARSLATVGSGVDSSPGAADLVVEVYSPGNRRGKILEKLAEYLGAGIPLVWIVYPKSRTVTMYRSLDEPPDVLKQDAVIENLPELPGFRCPVADFFL